MNRISRSAALPCILLTLLTAGILQAEDQEKIFTQAELDQMLAPIALYPDTVLAQVLTASTYPIEVVEAARWSRQNPNLEGARAVEAAASMDWDPSVQALTAFPNLLARMDEDLEWTRRLGDAVLLQESEVMDRIQDLRLRAYEAGNLRDSPQVTVQREREVIVIQPATPTVVYVPYYSTRVVYGNWWWPAYPPVYWAPPPGYSLGMGFYWGRGFRVTTTVFHTCFDWPHRHFVVVGVYRPRPVVTTVVHHHHHHYSPHPRWVHDVKHRRGVAYRTEYLQHYYGRSSASGLPEARGYEPRLRPGASRPEGPQGAPPVSARSPSSAVGPDRFAGGRPAAAAGQPEGRLPEARREAAADRAATLSSRTRTAESGTPRSSPRPSVDQTRSPAPSASASASVPANSPRPSINPRPAPERPAPAAASAERPTPRQPSGTVVHAGERTMEARREAVAQRAAALAARTRASETANTRAAPRSTAEGSRSLNAPLGTPKPVPTTTPQRNAATVRPPPPDRVRTPPPPPPPSVSSGTDSTSGSAQVEHPWRNSPPTRLHPGQVSRPTDSRRPPVTRHRDPSGR